jgi:hypothetical protein
MSYQDPSSTFVQAAFTYQTVATLSNVTPTSSVFNPDIASANLIAKSLATASFSSRNSFSGSYLTPLYISSNTTLKGIVNADGLYIDADVTNLYDASVSPNFNNITASLFTTNRSNGNVLISGDDAILKDVNLGNGFGIIGQQNVYRGWIKFGTNGPLVGHNGNQATPAPGDAMAITGSLLVSGSNLFMYTGCVTGSGWNKII